MVVFLKCLAVVVVVGIRRRRFETILFSSFQAVTYPSSLGKLRCHVDAGFLAATRLTASFFG